MQSGGFSSAANKHTTDFKILDYPPVLCLELIGSIVPRDSWEYSKNHNTFITTIINNLLLIF